MVSRPSLRARVYWLTSLIAELQPNIFDEIPNDHTSQGQSTASSFLSHLSTLCIPRVVALTSSTYTSHGTTIQVFSTPDSNNATGKVRHSVVHADTSSSTLDTIIGISILAPITSTTIPHLPFDEFVVETLQLFRAAAVRLQADPDDIDVWRAPAVYAVYSCLPKLKSRFKAFLLLYPAKHLRGWTPTSAERSALTDSEVALHDTHDSLLEIVGLKRIQNSNKYPFTGENAQSWWECIILLLGSFRSTLTPPDLNHFSTTSYSLDLHVILKAIPSQFWELKSLNAHLERCGAARASAASNTDGVLDQVDGIEALEVEEQISSLRNITRPSPRALPECVAFFRAADALSAWTTAALQVLQTLVKRPTLSIGLVLVDLPRLAIPATTPEALVSHWAGKQKWTPDFQSTIQSKLTPLLNKESSGACHAEAGLIASLISHVGKTQGGLVSGDARDVNDDGTAGEVEEERVVDGDVRNVDDDDVTAGEVEEGKMEGRMADVRDVDEEEEEPAEPEELTTAFQKMFPEGPPPAAFAIGVAKKCCPVCRLLVELAEKRLKMTLQLPGKHGRYHPWIPPSWLPNSLLLELEKELLAVLASMLMTSEDFPGSRASSPGSDRGVEERPIFRASETPLAKFGVFD